MQVSIEELSGLKRRMTIGVPAETIENKVNSRLQDAARDFQMKGFRKGKVPLKVIKNRYGKGVRQEVLGEVMSESYYEAVNQENVQPAGQPEIEAKTLEEGKDLEFTATFEVYPEVSLEDFSNIEVEKKTAEIREEDVDKMIETLRRQRMEYKEVDRAAQQQDMVNIDFEGTMEGEKFEGGEASGMDLILGSNRMIEGFEAGLVGACAGEEVNLSLTFPENYHHEALAGKPVTFKVKVNQVSEPVLPELDEDFFASFDIKEGGLAAFREEVANNMARELKNASRNNIKNQVIEGLLRLHRVEIPQALVDNEIQALKQQAIQQYGGGSNLDPSQLPDDMFRDQAQRRAKTALVMGEIVKQYELKAEPQAVRALVEEIAETYEQPEEVVKWYYSDQNNLAQVESMALEEAVINKVLESARVNEVETPYEDALKPTQTQTEPQAGEAEEAQAGEAPAGGSEEAAVGDTDNDESTQQ